MMNTSALKRFAQAARRQLMEQVAARLDRVLTTDSAELREKEQAVKQLKDQIRETSRDAVIERVAYTWFNRFCALRFMDANRYTRLGIVSPAEERTQPEILAEAKQGYIHDSFKPFLDSEKIFDLLSGRQPSSAPQQEAYRLLLVGVCNYYHRSMRFLFPKIDDYTELLMPEDLLSENAVLTAVRETLSPDNCQNVEVIGWLYQFYISEKKDEVFAGLKKGRKITPQNIPAATQLFTPHWIVRYLVENSLGRLWMKNHPESRLVDRMEYYIPDDSVDSEKWEVRSKGDENESEKLPRTDSLAKGNGLSGNGLSSDKKVSQGGALRTNQSDKESGSVDSIEHSRRSGATINSGVQKLSFDSSRLASRSGNTDNDIPTTQLHTPTTDGADPQPHGRNKTDDLFSDSEAQLTSHFPLPTSHLRISSPKEIRLCDPACGSGHMLTYAFDLLYRIYEEEGTDPTEIPRLILENNLYGIEIDERAGELAAFALVMKAREKYKRFLSKPVQPNICVLRNIELTDGELVDSDQWLVAGGASREDILHDLHLFEEADNFGSLLCPRLSAGQSAGLRDYLAAQWALADSHSLFESMTHEKVLQALRQAEYLGTKYHVVIANPPYMGGKGMNPRLKAFAKDNYPRSKSDLFAMFIERNLDLACKQGTVAMITMQSWMFLSSFEKLRTKLLEHHTIVSMAHLGARAFDSIGGEVVSTTAFVLENEYYPNYRGAFIRLVDGESESEKARMLKEAIQ